MGWRYRKRIKLLPGVHINISKSGISTNVGVKGASVTIGSKGTYVNTGIPGTGLYRRDRVSKNGHIPTDNNQNNREAFTENTHELKDYDDKLLTGKILQFVIGVILLLMALFTIVAICSLYFSAAYGLDVYEGVAREYHNWGGRFGAQLAHTLVDRYFGVCSLLIPIFFLQVSMKIMGTYKVRLWKWFLNLGFIMVWGSVALSVCSSEFFPASLRDVPFKWGGEHGDSVRDMLMQNVGLIGTLIILGLCALLYLIYLSGETLHAVKSPPSSPEETINLDTITENEEAADIAPTSSPEDQELVIDEGEDDNDEETEGSTAGNDAYENLPPYDPRKDLEYYKFPTIDLLKKYDTGDQQIDMEEHNANKDRIVKILDDYGAKISAIRATVGPTVTHYELAPAPGVHISKIKTLSDDIALALSAIGVRIIAPIPGKGTISIEVPNKKPKIVSLESLINSKRFQDTNYDLPIALGKTITNEVFMVDLAKMPHLLVAGATGQGKSVSLNAIITSLLYKKHPAELKLVLMDPSGLEFSPYLRIANHFLVSQPNGQTIVSNSSQAIATLNSLCREMEIRHKLLKKAFSRNIKEYNQMFIHRQLNPANGHRFLPYIVVVIDEYGYFIEERRLDIEQPLTRLAQFARAVGIHMIISTKRPSNDIITGTIKSNFPTRISFRVPERIDSRVILDCNGAEKLLGDGDMLYLDGKGVDCIRVQGAFIDTSEVLEITKFISGQQGFVQQYYLPDVADDTDDSCMDSCDVGPLDSMFEEAARLIIIHQQGSTSLIQRKMGLGYNRAGRIMDQLEAMGIVGPSRGAKPREVLVPDEVALNAVLEARK